MRVLFIGDIMGSPGITAVASALKTFKSQGREYDFIIANVENAAGGFGLTAQIWETVTELGLDCMTSGNHIWDRPDVYKFINDQPKLLRPANYPPGNPGFGWQAYRARNGVGVAVINLQGRIYMTSIDCPFREADAILEEIGSKYNIVVVDFHADASSEKQAMGWYLDGRVSAVIGTHTHVQTAEERVLPGGTGFITDVGMCGAYNSVIGMEIEDALFRLLKARPNRLRVAHGDVKFAGAEFEIDETTGKCVWIERLLIDIATGPGKQAGNSNG